MKNILLVLLLLPLFVFSQEEDFPKRGIKIYGGYNYTTKLYLADEENKWITDKFKYLEKPNFSNSFGILRIKPLANPKYTFEYGIGYSGHEFKSSKIDSIFADGIFFPDKKLIHEYYLGYLNFPFNLRYELYKKSKVSITAFTGLIFNFFLEGLHSSRIITDDINYRYGANSFEQRSDASIQVGVGLEYELTKRIRLELNPYLSQTYSSGEESQNYKSYLNVLGLNLGVHFIGK